MKLRECEFSLGDFDHLVRTVGLIASLSCLNCKATRNIEGI